MDNLKNVGQVQDEINNITSIISTIETVTTDLQSDKEMAVNAWQSENAAKFIGQYDQLTQYLTEAASNLKNYKDKINNVVTQIIGFDTTLEQQSEAKG